MITDDGLNQSTEKQKDEKAATNGANPFDFSGAFRTRFQESKFSTQNKLPAILLISLDQKTIIELFDILTEQNENYKMDIKGFYEIPHKRDVVKGRLKQQVNGKKNEIIENFFSDAWRYFASPTPPYFPYSHADNNFTGNDDPNFRNKVKTDLTNLKIDKTLISFHQAFHHQGKGGMVFCGNYLTILIFNTLCGLQLPDSSLKNTLRIINKGTQEKSFHIQELTHVYEVHSQKNYGKVNSNYPRASNEEPTLIIVTESTATLNQDKSVSETIQYELYLAKSANPITASAILRGLHEETSPDLIKLQQILIDNLVYKSVSTLFKQISITPKKFLENVYLSLPKPYQNLILEALTPFAKNYNSKKTYELQSAWEERQILNELFKTKAMEIKVTEITNLLQIKIDFAKIAGLSKKPIYKIIEKHSYESMEIANNNKLDDGVLIQLLEESKNIRQLRIINCPAISDSIIAYLRQFPEILVLEIKGTNLKKPIFEMLSVISISISNCKDFTSLEFSSCINLEDFRIDSCKNLKRLKSNTKLNLKTILIDECPIKEEELVAILNTKIIERARFPNSIPKNKLKEKIPSLLGENLKEVSTLIITTALDLNNHNVKLPAVEFNKPLTYLELDIISYIIADNSSLLTLKLTNQQLEPQQLKKFILSLKKNQTIKHLNFSSNKFTNENLKIISEFFHGNMNIISLDLSDNNIDEINYTCIKKIFEEKNSLKELNLSNNKQLNYKAISEIIASKNFNLNSLNLEKTGIVSSDLEKLAENYLPRNSTLTELKFSKKVLEGDKHTKLLISQFMTNNQDAKLHPFFTAAKRGRLNEQNPHLDDLRRIEDGIIRGINLLATDQDGNTALHLAASLPDKIQDENNPEEHKIKIVKTLCDAMKAKDLPLNSKNKSGQTASDIAAVNKYWRIKAVMLNASSLARNPCTSWNEHAIAITASTNPDSTAAEQENISNCGNSH